MRYYGVALAVTVGILLTCSLGCPAEATVGRLCHAEGDSIETILNRLLNTEQRQQALLELGRLAYARGLYHRALSMLAETEGDTAYFFRAMSLTAIGKPAESKKIADKVTEKTLRAYLLSLQERDRETGKYYLHFGSFTKREKALAFVKKLNKTNMRAEVEMGDEGFIVLSGPYSSRREAELEATTKARIYLWRVIKR